MLKATLSRVFEDDEAITVVAVNLDSQEIEYLVDPKKRDEISRTPLSTTVFLKDGGMPLSDFIRSTEGRSEEISKEAVDQLTKLLAKGLGYLRNDVKIESDLEDTDELVRLPDYGLSVAWDSLPIKVIEGGQPVYRYAWTINQETCYPGSFHEPPSSDLYVTGLFPSGKEASLVSTMIRDVSHHDLQNALQAFGEDQLCEELEDGDAPRLS